MGHSPSVDDEPSTPLNDLLSTSRAQPRWYTQPHLLRLNFSILSLVSLSSAIGYDASMMNGLLALPTWNAFMDYPTGAWLGFINASYVLGILVALPICPFINNRYGRKWAIWVGYAFMIPGVALQASAKTEATFIVARALLGVNTAWFASSAPVLIAEVAYPTHRVCLTQDFPPSRPC